VRYSKREVAKMVNTSDRLSKMWKTQLEFNKNFFNPGKLTLEQKQQRTKDTILYLQSELNECLQEINFKEHRRTKEVREDKLVEELIDVQKYVLCLAQIWNVTPDKYYNEFERKSLVVAQRYLQEMKLKLLEDKNVVGIDLDNVLCDWNSSFIKFVKQHGFVITEKELSMNSFKVLTNEKFKELKHKFRLSGLKKKLKVLEGAREVTQSLSNLNYTIIILSARPVKEYPKLFADTIEWLKANRIAYHAVYFDDDKNNTIIKEFPRMKFFVEDTLDYANSIAKKGYKVFLLNKNYNSEGLTHKNVVRVDKLNEIILK